MVYTAATFAQTKFGSTKLKTNSKKPNRMSPTEFSNYIKQRAMQKSLQQQNNGGYGQQQQQQGGGGGFYDKYYSPSSPCYAGSGNSNSSNMNFNNFPKSLTSQTGGTGGTNDYNNFGLNSGLSNNGFANGLNLSDYSSLLTDWPDSTTSDQDTNAFLHDILSSAGVGGTMGGGGQQAKSMGGRMNNASLSVGGSSYDEWMNGGVGLGFNANHALNETSSNGLGPESRSSSTKSMSSGSEHSLPSPPGLQADARNGDGFGIQRVLVAN